VRWLISAVLDRVLEKMTSPLVVVRASQGAEVPAPELSRVLVALDQSDYSSEIIPVVQKIAQAFSASVTLCHAIAPNVDTDGRPQRGRGGAAALVEAELFMATIARQFAAEGIETDTVVAIGDAPTQIVQTAQRAGAGLIALTTRGRDRLGSRMGGSTATVILHSTRLPCLLTRRAPAGVIPGETASGTAFSR
jgi:nucleotide-binding universal stress UspA family protein